MKSGLLIFLVINEVFGDYINASAKYCPRIAGGKDAEEGKFPWTVALHFRTAFICTATLISDRHVLTAAHCVVIGGVLQEGREFNGYVGNVDRTSPETLLLVFEDAQPHPKYDKATWRFDVAILRTDSKVEFTDRIKRICLAKKAYKTSNPHHALAMGWGSITKIPPVKYKGTLQYAKLLMIRNTVCSLLVNNVDQTNMCALGIRTGILEGDSGGPLVTTTEHMVIGVASYTNLSRGVMIFMRTSHVANFIQSAINNTSQECFDKTYS